MEIQVHCVSQPYGVLICAFFYRALNTRQDFFGKGVFFLIKVILRGELKSVFWTKGLLGIVRKDTKFINCPLTL